MKRYTIFLLLIIWLKTPLFAQQRITLDVQNQSKNSRATLFRTVLLY